jgi:hypothetical protein
MTLVADGSCDDVEVQLMPRSFTAMLSNSWKKKGMKHLRIYQEYVIPRCTA